MHSDIIHFQGWLPGCLSSLHCTAGSQSPHASLQRHIAVTMNAICSHCSLCSLVRDIKPDAAVAAMCVLCCICCLLTEKAFRQLIKPVLVLRMLLLLVCYNASAACLQTVDSAMQEACHLSSGPASRLLTMGPSLQTTKQTAHLGACTASCGFQLTHCCCLSFFV
jgi:hypothetical protein